MSYGVLPPGLVQDCLQHSSLSKEAIIAEESLKYLFEVFKGARIFLFLLCLFNVIFSAPTR